MEKWHLIIDVQKCQDCNNCFLACKDEYVGNDFLPYSVAQPKHVHRWINIMRKERGQCPLVDVAFLPVPCMHCDDAPCIRKAKDGAVYKKDNGIVIIDPGKARGQKNIVDTCPYGVIWWNEEHNVPQKCTLCAHLLAEGWKEPRCVQACPTRALRVVKAEDSKMAQIIKDENLEVLRPEFETKPRVYYKNLYRYLKCFIGGSVAIEADGITDCAEGARVTLFKDSKKIAEAVTDNYGDFKFDNLEENSGKYSLEMIYEGHKKKTLALDLTTSKNIGTILL
jgi:Fe-S-cluster-containing dehydrogenase component